LDWTVVRAGILAMDGEDRLCLDDRIAGSKVGQIVPEW
jgi:hypothetical protein